MNKILKINIDDIIFDYREASDIINKACTRNEGFEVKCAFKRGKIVFVCLEEIDCFKTEKIVDYVFSKISNDNDEEIIAEIDYRYRYGFSTFGVFEIYDNLWALFGKKGE